MYHSINTNISNTYTIININKNTNIKKCKLKTYNPSHVAQSTNDRNTRISMLWIVALRKMVDIC